MVYREDFRERYDFGGNVKASNTPFPLYMSFLINIKTILNGFNNLFGNHHINDLKLSENIPFPQKMDL
jgi:hypothetical protein